MIDKIRALLKRKKMNGKSNDFRGFARLLTEIDNLGSKALSVKELIHPQSVAFRIGITGPPGAGKSTLLSGLIKELRKQKLKVGVLAVDPSSPFSMGALLGDRIRYAEALEDEEVFVRSIGSRGSPGGLSASSYLLLRAFDAWGFDVVLIETVGVGQTELEIINVADWVSVVLVPESGDGVQMMKAGLMEIADSFVVNKADRPGAESLIHELRDTLTFEGVDAATEIFKTVATENIGIEAIANSYVAEYKKKNFIKTRNSPERLQAEAKALLRFKNEEKLSKQVQKIKTIQDLSKLF